VRELWEARDRIAQQLDATPSRLIPDSAILAAANAMPTNRRTLLETKGFHGRGARRYAEDWVDALKRARALPEKDLPPLARRGDGPPQARAWADRDPAAAARLAQAREAVKQLSESTEVPAENLLTPDYLRRVLWTPPTATGPTMEEAVAEQLRELGARPWQVELTAGLISDAILAHPSD
jgi:ribonuclease D